MKPFHQFVIVTVPVILLMSGLAGQLYAQEYEPDSPAGVISRYGETTVKTLNNDKLLQQESRESLRRRLLNQLSPILDFQLMTRMALGPQARRISDKKLTELVNVFRPLVVRSYTAQLFQYMVKPENPWILKEYKIKNQQYHSENRYATVSVLVNMEKNGRPRDIALDFKMINKTSGSWKVYDLLIENISLVENYRSQFSSILTGHSVDYLIKQLQQKLNSARPVSSNRKIIPDTG